MNTVILSQIKITHFISNFGFPSNKSNSGDSYWIKFNKYFAISYLLLKKYDFMQIVLKIPENYIKTGIKY